MNENVSFLKGKKCVLLNFTADTYHWGCFATSIELYSTLIEAGYFVDTRNVMVTQLLGPTPDTIDQFNDPKFFDNFCNHNADLCRTIDSADLVMVNGEGTLHRLSKAALNLLYLMLISKRNFKKEVHLVNFSCFPNGDETPAKGFALLYPQILKHLDRVVTRENQTQKILRQSGVDVELGFDCLPRFLNRHQLTNIHSPNGYVLLSGGVNMPEVYIDFYTEFLNWLDGENIPTKFLVGARAHQAKEDWDLWQTLKKRNKDTKIEIIDAKTLEEWVGAFKGASFSFTARFHFTLASLCVGAPCRAFASNTPKISAALETLGEFELSLEPDNRNFTELKKAVSKAIDRKESNVSTSRLKRMLELSANNFSGLEKMD